MTQSLSNTSKFLSYVLRHKPDAIGLTLDPEGWAKIEVLIAKADLPLDLETLRKVVATSDKKRFAISADGLSIRANQGHSIAVNLGPEPAEPPEFSTTGRRPASSKASRYKACYRKTASMCICHQITTPPSASGNATANRSS